MKSKKFFRQDFWRFSKLGKNRKKLQKWRKPKGRDNKIREKRKGYPARPTIGHRSPRKSSGKIKGLIPCRVINLTDIEKASKNNILIIARVGAKKRIELIKKANEKNLKILNLSGGSNET